MAALAFVLLILAITAGQSSANWCICKEGMSDTVLQKALDYACGAGADCNPIHTSGGCYNPNTVRAHCNYAVNSYFQKKGQTQGSCDFSGAATVVTSDPSTTGCSYPATASAAGTSTTPVTTTPTTGTTPNTGTTGTTPTTGTTGTTGTTPSTSTTTTTSPYTNTPSTGTLGGINGVGPAGPGINDESSGFRLLSSSSLFSSSITLFFSGLMLWWG